MEVNDLDDYKDNRTDKKDKIILTDGFEFSSKFGIDTPLMLMIKFNLETEMYGPNSDC